MTRHATTRRLLVGLFAAALLPAFGAARAADPEVLRIGYQKYGTLTLLKAQGTLEKRLAAQGVSVKWTEFPAGPQLLEGLNVGSIDFGTVGEAPPIFAQAAGANFVYVANEPPAPESEAIVVPKDSPLHSVKDLKGKRIALNKGSNVHYLLVRLLEQAGVAYKDVETVYLAPADARAAFERGAVDAWVIWDPYLASAQTQLSARVLADGKGVVSNHQFYLAARPYAERKPELVRAVVEELEKVDAWGRANPDEVAKVLGPAIGLDPATAQLAARRFSYGVKPVSIAVLDEQQKIADTFTELKLIPRKLVIRDAAPRELSIANR
jgi:sulfonate transport system substrate-binding protein